MKEIITAEEEYSKHPKLKKEAVDELAEWIKEQPEFPITTEVMVIRFLFSCYFDMENAKKCVKQYYSIKLQNPVFFLNKDILQEDLHSQLSVIQYGVLPKKDPNGYTVIVHRLQVYEPSQYNFFHSCRLFGMLIDSINWKEGNMNGLVVIFDMVGVSLMHVFRLKLATLKLFTTYVQEACPIRLKAVHVVNTLPIAAKIMFILKPLLKKELIELIHFHSSNYEEIQRHLPVDCLPSDFGGTQPTIAQLHEDYKKWMLEMRDVCLGDDEEIKEYMVKWKEVNDAKQKKSSWNIF